MDKLIEALEKFGIEVVLLLGFSYAFYKFFFFSIREVKNEFTKRHDYIKGEIDSANKSLIKLNEKIERLIDKLKQ
jgi:F0F1-type ATP synthase membrane subunit b/b'